MRFKNLKNSRNGVVGIVTAVLLLGLIISILALTQTVYVPRWMEQKEAEHMEVVRDQFSQLKFAIDIHSANEQEYTPIATSITMGSKELPFFMSQRSYGVLEIISDEFVISITNDLGSIEFIKPLGIIKYSSDNAYFIDQSFIYETGAIITSQSDGDSISIKPVFIPLNNSNNIDIFITLINISSVGNKTAYGGFDTTAIQTEYCNCSPKNDTIYNSRYINITTSYPESWGNYVNSSLQKELAYGADFKINVLNKLVSIEFINNYIDIKLDLKTIYAQIGPGWIDI